MVDYRNIADLHAAYLCVKDSVADDLVSCSEVKHVLQFAGLNPTHDYLQQIWVEGSTEAISYEEFCRVANQLEPLSESAVKKIVCDAFILSDDSVLVKDLKNLLLVSKRPCCISEHDIDSIIEEVGEKDGSVKVADLCKVIHKTVTDVKQMAFENLSERGLDKRTNSRTFTKKTSLNGNHLTKFGSIDVKDWYSTTLKGSLFIDGDFVISHQYYLELSTIGQTVIKISPLKFESTILTADIVAYIFREAADGSRIYIGYTSLITSQESNYWIDTLKEGKYIIIPYTTGCIKRKPIKHSRNTVDLIHKENIQLTSDCQRILEQIFHQMDLDGNNLLNRQEFNLYNWRSSGEVVQDDEWEVVQKNFDVENGELTFKGFLSLHQLEAEDNGGDSDELWLSLETVGFNRYGDQDKCCPFSVSVFSQAALPFLQVSGLKSGGILLDKAVIRSTMESSNPESICSKSPLFKYQFKNEKRASIVIQNKSNEDFKIKIDCSQSVNSFSNRENMIWEGTIEKKSAVVAHHLAAIDNLKPWILNCKESLLES